MLEFLKNLFKKKEKQSIPDRKLKLSFMERLKKSQQAKKQFTVRYGVYHDGVLVTAFNMNIKARNKEHAWTILKNQVTVKPVSIQ